MTFCIIYGWSIPYKDINSDTDSDSDTESEPETGRKSKLYSYTQLKWEKEWKIYLVFAESNIIIGRLVSCLTGDNLVARDPSKDDKEILDKFYGLNKAYLDSPEPKTIFHALASSI